MEVLQPFLESGDALQLLNVPLNKRLPALVAALQRTEHSTTLRNAVKGLALSLVGDDWLGALTRTGISDWQTIWVPLLCSLPDRVANCFGVDDSNAFAPSNFNRRLCRDVEYVKMDPNSAAIFFSKLIRIGRAQEAMETLKDCDAGWWSSVMAALLERERQSLFIAWTNFLHDCTESAVQPWKRLNDRTGMIQAHAAKTHRLFSVLLSEADSAMFLTQRILSGSRRLYDIDVCRIVIQAISQSDGFERTFARVLTLLLGQWSDPFFVKSHADVGVHRQVAFCILTVCARMNVIPTEVRTILMKGIPQYLESSHVGIRSIGLRTAELVLQKFSTERESSLDFGLVETAELTWLRLVMNAVDEGNASGVLENLNINDVDDADTGPIDECDHCSDGDSESSLEPLEDVVGSAQSTLTIRAPRYLRECVDYLRQASTSENDDADKIEACFSVLLALIRTHIGTHDQQSTLAQKDFRDAAPHLASRLVYLKDNYDLDDFAATRFHALVLLCVGDPAVGEFLIQELWQSKGLNWSQRLEVMDVLVAAAQSLATGDVCGQAESKPVATVDSLQAIQSQCDKPNADVDWTESKTRYFHPISRAKNYAQQQSTLNQFHAIASKWTQALMRGLVNANMDWFLRECGIDRPASQDCPVSAPRGLRELFSKFDIIATTEQPTVSVMAVELLTKWLTTVALLLLAAGPSLPLLADIAGEYGECVAWLFQSGDGMQMDNRQSLAAYPPFRRCLLVAFWTVLALGESLPDMDALPFGWTHKFGACGGLSAIIEWAMRVSTEDTDAENRLLARHVGLQIKRRLERAVYGNHLMTE